MSNVQHNDILEIIYYIIVWLSKEQDRKLFLDLFLCFLSKDVHNILQSLINS